MISDEVSCNQDLRVGLRRCKYTICITPSSLEEKLKWIFNVYDKDACGTLDPEEIGDAVRGLFAMVGMEEIPEDILEIRSRELREAIDVDGDGQITKEEFIKNAMTCEFICDLMQIGALGDENEDED